jgi:serine/threonine protein kinase
MSESLGSRPIAETADRALADIVAEITDRLHAGQLANIDEYITRHPEFADRLQTLLPSLELLHACGSAPSNDTTTEPSPGTLGDFRILREIGRGGMGVVYEAEQISLGRRVALKVLPFASTLDPKQLQRFKNEAQAAAHLHHQSIVPVHATGCERGVHYYAMQFIEGQTLAALIADIRRQAQQARAQTEPASAVLPNAAKGLPTPGLLPPEPPVSAPVDSWPTAPGTDLPLALPELSDTMPKAGISTECSTASPAFIRAAAQLGVQAAEALEHAHQLGIVHRDIKPANLLVDARGNAWITDFGLAHCQNQAGLTMSGDLVGTLRYMSPEQALAQRVLIDHRTDIYSLGVTVYELLTLEPAFSGSDRQELLRQIAFEEPKPPRRLNRAIPAELETIVLKAMEKNAADRYATAQELADEFRRFLEDKPIQARRPSVLARLRKWSWRHRGAVSAAIVSAVVALAAASGFTAWQWREAKSGRIQAEQAGGEARKQEHIAKAINQFFVKDLLGAASPEEALGGKLTVEEVLDKAAARIEGAFPDQPEVEASVRMAIGETYVNLGLYHKAEPHLRRALVIRREVLGEEHPDTLESITQMGNMLACQDRQAEAQVMLQEALAVARRVLGDEHPTTLGLLRTLAQVLNELGRLPEAEEMLRDYLQIQRRIRGPKDEATLSAMCSLGECLVLQGKWDEAESLARDCLDIGKEVLPKDHPMVMTARGVLVYVLTWEGKTRELEPVARENVDAANQVWGPDHPKRWGCVIFLAIAYYLQGKFTDAERLADEVFRTIDSGLRGESLVVLGFVYRAQGRWAEAENLLRQAVDAQSRIRGSQNSVTFFQLWALGTVLQALGKRAEARTALRAALDGRRKVVPASPFLAESLHALAEFLLEEGESREAEEALREALDIQRRLMPSRHRSTGQTLAALGWALTKQGRAKDAEPFLREGVEICRTGYPLGQWATADAETGLDWATATAESRLAGCLTALEQFGEAEKLLLSSYETLQKAAGTPPQRRVEAADRIIKLYEAWGKPTKAAEWRATLPAVAKPADRKSEPRGREN